MLPRRHRRSIRIEHRRYFWHFTSGREYDHRHPQLVVQHAQGLVILIVRQPTWPKVTPGFVRAIINEATLAGWSAAQGTGQIILTALAWAIMLESALH